MDQGSRAKFTFTGKRVQWVGYRDQWSGIAKVYVDGAYKKSIDTYASPYKAQTVLFTQDNLSAGSHTIEIEATQTKRSISAGAWVWVDAFLVSQ